MRRLPNTSGGARAIRYPVHFPASVPHFAFPEKLLAFVKANAVMTVAFVAALVTMVIVPVDSAYLGYLFPVYRDLCKLNVNRTFGCGRFVYY